MTKVPLPRFEESDDTASTSLPVGESTANTLLFELFLQNIAAVHDREVNLTKDECAQFVRSLRSRTRNDAPPFKYGEERLSAHASFATRAASHERTFRRRSTDSLLSQCSSQSTGSQRRKISQSQTTTPSSSAQPPEASPQTDTTCTGDDAQGRAVPTWRCFIKALTSTHLVMTFVPAGYEHLLLLSEGVAGLKEMRTRREQQARVKTEHDTSAKDTSPRTPLTTSNTEAEKKWEGHG